MAWRQGGTTSAPATNDVRAARVTRAGGRIDADGGVLLATAATAITGGPSAAFDGTLWLVAWTESTTSGHDLKAVTVAADERRPTPAVIAQNVLAQEPAISSTRDGRTLVGFTRDEGAYDSIRAVMVAP
ncbi:MAG TPA: hypothetical protein VEC57_19900 [Candidatus Limnocylindrales bacterium]|nr:hypothetical protein [Candidatus Limnocylindrales bacterium]